ncbi:MAG: pyruvate dehydrogenase complex dihydrolipoamide acetyltransferase [Flavobacteriales bacterium]|nr:pyruvate dehydrogenase complex dihydrolipoamide acetyltransferase [Flavobacteriales bacterium]
MAVALKLPKMSDTMEEGVIVSWQVKVGDEIKSGDILAEVETDKATMDLENYEKGTVLHLNVEEGKAIAVDSIIAIVGKKGEDFSALLSATPKKAEAPTEAPAEKEIIPSTQPATPAAIETTVGNSDSRILASPLAKKMASDKGIDIAMVAGSGENGRIIKRDVESYSPAVMPASVSGTESFTTVPVSQMRKTIARRLSESKFTAPHFYLTMEIRMDNAIAARQEMNQFSEVKISMNDLVVKAAATALTRHPKVNSSWLGDTIRINNHIHVGVAMAVDEGLLVPVVKHANNKSLSQISTEVKAFSAKAKDKKLQPADWEGNTFTISNLGMFGIEEFTAIVNPPDACIMAVGASKETVLVENGEMKIGNVMKVTLSCDHRVVDGVVGSQFLLTFKELMENPVKILV